MNKKEALKILHETLGDHYQTSKKEHYFKCPACNHRKHKFAVNLDKNAFHCWICDYRGRNLRRVVRRFGSYIQLQKWDAISDRTDLERFADLFVERRVEENPPKVELPEEFISLCSEKVPATGVYALKYLKSRGITKADILKWKIGYCFGGEYRNRVVVPSFDDDGDCSYFIARSYTGDSYKYKNPRASKDIVFNELFIDWNTDVILVEGVFDALVAGNAVPILGSTLKGNSDLLRKIVRNDTPIYIALDPDAAAKERRIIEMLLRYDIELYKIDVSGYEDVGSMTKEIFEERKNNASFIDRDNYLLLNLLSAV
jgi:DNA primase|tara:strand:+ start:592 stop:1533 length:942 start_codon:yes stop_codon:yes gene_type:complete